MPNSRKPPALRGRIPPTSSSAATRPASNSAGTPEFSRIAAFEERARQLKQQTRRDLDVDSALKQIATLRKEDSRFVRRNDAVALLESVKAVAGPRRPEIERALADYVRDADVWKELAGWYPFDAAATLASDASPAERHGTAGGAAWDVEDAPRKGVLRLQGDAELVLPVAAREDFSIAFWLKTRQAAPSGDLWFHGAGIVDADMPGSTSDFGVSLLGARVAFGIGGAPDKTIRSTSDVADGRWRHVAATYRASDGSMRLYVGGVLEAEGRGSAGTRAAPDQVVVGRLLSGTGRFAGSLDDLRFYARVLGDVDVRTLASK